MTTAELHTENPDTDSRLRSRQDEFAALLGVDPESLRHLEFCKHCDGEDAQWNDLPFDVLDMDGLGQEDFDEAAEYRGQVGESMCLQCDGTGFKSGSFELTPEDWQQLGR